VRRLPVRCVCMRFFLRGAHTPFPSQKTPVFFIGDITNELWQLSLSLAFNLILFYNHLKLLVFSSTLKCDEDLGNDRRQRTAYR